MPAAPAQDGDTQGMFLLQCPFPSEGLSDRTAADFWSRVALHSVCAEDWSCVSNVQAAVLKAGLLL